MAGSLPGKRFVFLLQLKNTSCCGQENVFEMGGSRRVGSGDGWGVWWRGLVEEIGVAVEVSWSSVLFRVDILFKYQLCLNGR